MLATAEELFKDMAELGRETPQMRFRKAAMLHSFANNYAVLGQTYKRRERLLEAHRLLQSLAASDPKNLDWQNDLSVSYEAIGDLRVSEGNVGEAFKCVSRGH